MSHRVRHLTRLGLAVVLVALAYLGSQSIRELQESPAVLFLLAVALTARFGGMGPAVLATLSSTLLLDYFFVGEIHSVEVGRQVYVLLAIFAAVAVLISSLHAAQRRLEGELRTQNRRQSQFMAVLAHELRNFLAPMTQAVSLLRLRGRADEASERSYAIIERQAGNMSRMVGELLDVARINEGKVQLVRARTDLGAIVSHAVQTVHPLIDARGHELVVSRTPEALPLDADGLRLEQVFVNLLTNAAKYTSSGGRIWLGVERRDGGYEVRVKDSGEGIDAELLPHVFELFAQADAGARGGLGIGLSLVRSLVEMHGGSVTASSLGRGRGSEFVVRLPAGVPASAEIHPAGAETRASGPVALEREPRAAPADSVIRSAVHPRS